MSKETGPDNRSGKEVGHRPPYNDHFGIVKIPEEDRETGGDFFNLFYRRLIRPHPWNIKDGIVTIVDTRKQIGFKNEKISQELARVIAGFKMVEDFLPDYVGIGTELIRSNMGLFMLNTQWAGEELLHGLLLGSILEGTGYKIRRQIIEEYQANLERKIELPYSTPRLVNVQRVFQEYGTAWGYLKLYNRALEEGAANIAKGFGLLVGDESYHGWGFGKLLEIDYNKDKEEAIRDIEHAGEHFRFPADKLHPDPLQWTKDLIRVGAYNVEEIAKEVIYDTVLGLSFIPEPDRERLASETADRFLRKTSPKKWNRKRLQEQTSNNR